jgi:hypothetical protein
LGHALCLEIALGKSFFDLGANFQREGVQALGQVANVL